MWAFSNESERVGISVFAVVFIAPSGIDDARAALRGLLLPGQRKVHTSDESDRRRRTVLDTVARINGLTSLHSAIADPAGRHRTESRRTLVTVGAEAVVAAGATSWTLDDVPPTVRNRDRDAIGHALRRLPPTVVVYDHRRSRTEPLLSAAAAVCWAVGAGGDWQRRIASVTTVRDFP